MGNLNNIDIFLILLTFVCSCAGLVVSIWSYIDTRKIINTKKKVNYE